MSIYPLPRHISPPALIHTPLVEQDSRTPKAHSPPESPALILGTIDYTKREDQVYHTEKNERHNMDEFSELSIDAT